MEVGCVIVLVCICWLCCEINIYIICFCCLGCEINIYINLVVFIIGLFLIRIIFRLWVRCSFFLFWGLGLDVF